jgi:hypothetical protein
VLRKIFGSNRETEAGGRTKLHNDELHDLPSSPDITRIIQLRTIKWAGRSACMRKARRAYRYFYGKPGRNKHLSRLAVEGRFILKLVLKN